MSLEVIAAFHTDEPVIDDWTFVVNSQEPNGMYDMLATNDTPDYPGCGFSQWCSGIYDPEGDNSHLGEQVPFTVEAIGQTLMRHVLGRLHEGGDDERT